ncbi:single-stranded DNA-binding protein [Chitinophaga sp. 22321]|uniref:Single-stranded DNA-binding protein n=1 Tax=Chitinophaga hostae TaxID=2831022 RepID=A0ABS5IYC9_9BACT|nr:single-stranded DNA-binding protein [Chitinophaga hostae]MBS0027222.1 single-stranded DNA-binding protein [Chitinophaga hostae]
MNIIGRLTADAQVRTTTANKEVVSFSLAVNDSYRNKQGERINQPTYFDCSYWLSTGVAKFLAKGTLVELTGRVSVNAWTGKDGKAHAGLNFHTSQIKLYGGSGKNSNAQEKPEPQKNKKTDKENGTGDLPF